MAEMSRFFHCHSKKWQIAICPLPNVMYSSQSTKASLVASRHSATSDGPLTAERAMLDQIRSKLERAQRRLARTSSSSYVPSDSGQRAIPVKSVGMDSARSRRHGPLHHHSATPHAHYQHSAKPLPHQYKSKSKFADMDTDPLNGGPPPLSTPYLVYSGSRPSSIESTSSRDTQRLHDPPRSSLRSGVARPPTSRVRFQGYEDTSELRQARINQDERQRRKEQLKEREARYKQQCDVRSNKLPVASPITTATRHSVANDNNPPNSAIKASAYQQVAQTMTSGRRSGDIKPPPTSDIQVNAFQNVLPRRGAGKENVASEEPENGNKLEQLAKNGKPEDATRKMEPEELDENDTSFDTDDSYEFDSEAEAFSPSEYAIVRDQLLQGDLDSVSDKDKDKDKDKVLASDLEESTTSRLTTKDLAFHALGRTSNCSQSDYRSPVPSSEQRASSTTSRPMASTPAPCATRSSRVATRNYNPPTSSIASYVRRSRSRKPMDLKNHLPPSIGVLSDLSSGSSTFILDTTRFYEVEWTVGEFAFSVHQVFTEPEYEFDDQNQEQLFLRMLLNTERGTCASFEKVRVGDVLIRVGNVYVSELGLEGSGSVVTKFFTNLMAQLPVKLTFQRMRASDWDGGVEL